MLDNLSSGKAECAALKTCGQRKFTAEPHKLCRSGALPEPATNFTICAMAGKTLWPVSGFDWSEAHLIRRCPTGRRAGDRPRNGKRACTEDSCDTKVGDHSAIAHLDFNIAVPVPDDAVEVLDARSIRDDGEAREGIIVSSASERREARERARTSTDSRGGNADLGGGFDQPDHINGLDLSCVESRQPAAYSLLIPRYRELNRAPGRSRSGLCRRRPGCFAI